MAKGEPAAWGARVIARLEMMPNKAKTSKMRSRMAGTVMVGGRLIMARVCTPRQFRVNLTFQRAPFVGGPLRTVFGFAVFAMADEPAGMVVVDAWRSL